MGNYNQVSYGSSDRETVTKLQELLNQNGANLEVDGKFGPKTLDAVKTYQDQNNLTVDGIVGENTWGALNKSSSGSGSSAAPEQPKPTSVQYEPYKPSDTVAQAEALLQQHLSQKPGVYNSPWQDQLNETLQKILNREEFSYDINGDALYHQYKDQSVNQGKMAMMDTVGQAAALTGGYGNSYAQTAGQQTYQGYLQHLNDRIPELYQLALSKYQMEGDSMRDQAALMAQMEQQDYGRHRDAVSDYYTEFDRLTDDARYQSEMDYSKWLDGRNFGYQKDRDKIADEQWQAQFDEAKRQFDLQYGKSSGSSSSSTGGNDTGYPGGNYTKNPGYSKEEILSIQKQAGIAEDGIWGPDTAAAYDSGIEPKDYPDAEPTNYYTQALNDLRLGKSQGKDNAWANEYLSALVEEGIITRSSQMTLYNKFRDNRFD